VSLLRSVVVGAGDCAVVEIGELIFRAMNDFVAPSPASSGPPHATAHGASAITRTQCRRSKQSVLAVSLDGFPDSVESSGERR
jgi:hypothetical protein